MKPTTRNLLRGLGILAMLFAGEALACRCGHSISPRRDARDVPTNTQIQLRGMSGFGEVDPSLQEIEVTAEGGTTVRFVRESRGKPGGAVFVSAQPLAPNTTYNYELSGFGPLNFTTGAAADVVAPAFNQPATATFFERKDSLFGPQISDTCEETHGWIFELGGGLDDQTPDEDLFLHAFYGATADEALTGPLSVVIGYGRSVSDMLCAENFDRDNPNHRHVALALVDRAGNVSERSNTISLAPPRGCSSTGVAFAPAMLLILTAMRARRNRSAQT